MHLRPLEPEDLDLLYEIENSPETWDVTLSDAPYSRFKLRQYISAGADIHACGELRLIIALREKGSEKETAIGLADLTAFCSLSAKAEVGIILLPEFRGLHHGGHALSLLENLAVSRLRIHQLYAHIPVSNDASKTIFQKAGYQLVATLPDWHFRRGTYEDVELWNKFF